MEIIQVTDTSEKVPPIYQGLRWRKTGAYAGDRFIGEGERVVSRALESSFHIASLVLTPDWFHRLSGRLKSRQPPVRRVFVVDKDRLDRAVGFRLRQGILAEIISPAPPKQAEWFRQLPEKHMLVALDGLSDAENVGAIVRNAAAFGLDGLIVDNRSAGPYLRRAVRVSMGAVFFLPIYKIPSLSEALEQLSSARKTRIIAATPDKDAPAAAAQGGAPGICLVMGSEGAGLSQPVLSKCDGRVRIPMERDWISLNVAAASAVLFHELARSPWKQQ